MNRNEFDDKDHEWDSSSWDNDFEGDKSFDETRQSRSPKFNFKLNPKIMAFTAAGVIGILLVISVLPRLLGGENSTNLNLKNPSASPTASVAVVDLYAQPKLLQSFIDNALASAVTIYCGNYSGSGWAIDLSDDSSTTVDDAYPTEIITNNHVIEGCEKSGVSIVPMGTSTEYDAFVYSFDSYNDLAILITNKSLNPFSTIQPGNEAHVGQWVMAVGSPGAGDTTLDGSITTGTITNIKEGVIITDTTINPGNSGGPLINAAGEVVAVVSAKIVDAKIDSIGIARNVNLICEQLAGCTKKRLLK